MKKGFFVRLLLTSAATSFGLMQTTVAAAQAGETDVGPEDSRAVDTDAEISDDNMIVVSGLRESLNKARSIKLNTDQFVDAVVAEDIGKLPDTNVAESLARVSGVQVDRGIGAGTSVSIRGLRENVTLYNGREVFDAVGRGGAGLDQTQTSTYGLLALVPAEVISRLEVTKLASAKQIAGGLGGIIDIVSRKPTNDMQIAASAGLTYEDLSGKAGAELFGLFSTRDASETLGILVSAAYTKRNLAENGLNTIGGYRSFVESGVTRFGLADYRAQQIEEERDSLGLSGVVEWEPSDSFKLTADTFYSRLTADRDRRWIAFNPTASLTNPTFSENDVLLSGSVVGGLNTNTEFQDNKSELWTSALRAELRPSDSLEVLLEVSMGDSSAELNRQFVRLTTSGVSPAIDFDLQSGPFGAVNISGVDLTA